METTERVVLLCKARELYELLGIFPSHGNKCVYIPTSESLMGLAMRRVLHNDETILLLTYIIFLRARFCSNLTAGH